jgi:multiple sugar transport system substrate-binding protein
MISRRVFLKTAGVSMAAAVLTACSPQAKEALSQTTPVVQSTPGAAENTMIVMGPASELPDQDFQGFHEKYPALKAERIDPDNARLQEMLAANTAPDIIRTDGADLQSLLLRSIPLDLTGYYATSKLLKADDFAPACEYYHVKGKWYGLPKDWSPDFSFYINTKIAQDAEADLPPFDQSIRYADLFELGRKLTKKDSLPLIIGYAYDQSFFARQIMAILLEENMTLYNEDFSQVILRDNPLVMEILQVFTEISQEGITWNPLTPCPTWPGQEFINGIEGIVGYGYWYHALLNNPGQDAKIDSSIVSFFPAPSWSGKKTINPTIGGSGYIGTRNTQNPDGVWSFLEWYLGDRPAQERAVSGWGVPALKSLYAKMPQANDFQKQVHQVLQYTFDHGDASYALKFNPYYADQIFNNSFNQNLEGVLKGSLTFNEMVEAVEKEVNTAIAAGLAARQ